MSDPLGFEIVLFKIPYFIFSISLTFHIDAFCAYIPFGTAAFISFVSLESREIRFLATGFSFVSSPLKASHRPSRWTRLNFFLFHGSFPFVYLYLLLLLFIFWTRQRCCFFVSSTFSYRLPHWILMNSTRRVVTCDRIIKIWSSSMQFPTFMRRPKIITDIFHSCCSSHASIFRIILHLRKFWLALLAIKNRV